MSNLFNYIREKNHDTKHLLLCGKKYGKRIIKWETVDTESIGQIDKQYDGQLSLLMSYFTNDDEKISFNSAITNNIDINLISGDVIKAHNELKIISFYNNLISGDESGYEGDESKYNVVILYLSDPPTPTNTVSKLWLNTLTKKSKHKIYKHE